MRTTTLPSMMECLGRNYSRNNSYVRLFEIGKVYIPSEDENTLPTEKNLLTIGMYGECDYLGNGLYFLSVLALSYKTSKSSVATKQASSTP